MWAGVVPQIGSVFCIFLLLLIVCENISVLKFILNNLQSEQVSGIIFLHI